MVISKHIPLYPMIVEPHIQLNTIKPHEDPMKTHEDPII